MGIDNGNGAVGLASIAPVSLTCTFGHTTFTANEARENGAAISAASPGTLEIYECTFLANRAGKRGGAISFLMDHLKILGSMFLGNTVRSMNNKPEFATVRLFSGSGGSDSWGWQPVWRVDDGKMFGNMSYQVDTLYTEVLTLSPGRRGPY